MALKPLTDYNPLAKLMVFVGMVIMHIFFFTLGGMLVGGGIWGSAYMQDQTLLNDLSNPTTVHYLKFIQVFAQVGMLMGTLLFVYLAYTHINTYMGIKIVPATPLAIAGIAIILVSFPLLNFLTNINEQIHLPASMQHLELWFKQQEDANNVLIDAFLNVQSLWGMLLNILFIALFTAIVEEFAFRGVLQNLLHELFRNRHIAVAVTALAFAFIHFQFYKLMPMLMLAFVLGYLYSWTGSIWLSVIVHFVYNATTILVVYLQKQNLISDVFDVMGKRPQDVIPVIVSLLLSAGLIYYIYITSSKRSQEQI